MRASWRKDVGFKIHELSNEQEPLCLDDVEELHLRVKGYSDEELTERL